MGKMQAQFCTWESEMLIRQPGGDMAANMGSGGRGRGLGWAASPGSI